MAYHIFNYPDCDPEQKRELERTIILLDLELEELTHLLSTSFPFTYLDRFWLESYVQLGQTYQQQGPFAGVNPALARWITAQRLSRKKGKLPLDRERALNRIGFVWNKIETLWQKHYEAYLAYQKDPAKRSQSLSDWISRMRRKWDSLTPRQQRLLKAAGFVPQPYADQWQKQYDAYLACKTNSSQANIPKSLRLWWNKRRRNWNQLSPEQRQLLRRAGMMPVAEKFHKSLKQLEAVYASQGNLHKLNVKLKTLVRTLRTCYQKGNLNPETIKRCNLIELQWFPVTTPADRWSARYAQALAFVQQAGPAIAPLWKWPDRKLYRWVCRQTANWNNLSQEQKRLLQQIQIKPRHEQLRGLWDEQYAKALALHTKKGPFQDRVSRNAVKDWLRNQQRRWDLLSDEQRERLEAIGLGKRAWLSRRQDGQRAPPPLLSNHHSG